MDIHGVVEQVTLMIKEYVSVMGCNPDRIVMPYDMMKGLKGDGYSICGLCVSHSIFIKTPNTVYLLAANQRISEDGTVTNDR